MNGPALVLLIQQHSLLLNLGFPWLYFKLKI